MKENAFRYQPFRRACSPQAAVLFGLVLLAGSLLAAAPSERPNVALILVDDLGWMDVGCYGSSFYDTPHIDRLAREGARFTDAYASASVCSPTRAALMTGKHPVRTGVTDWIPGRLASQPRMRRFMKLLPADLEMQLALEETTLAEALAEAGYRTGIFGKWHLGKSEAYWPENQGFDVNNGGWARGSPYYRRYDWRNDLWHGDSGFVSPYKNPRLEDGPEGEYLTDRLTDEAIAFIEASGDEPFFAYIPFYSVHNPLHAKPELLEMYRAKSASRGLDQVDPFVRNLPWMVRHDQRYPDQFKERVMQSNPQYAAMVASVDENIGRLLRVLEERGLEENTLVIFASDNGGLSSSEGSPTSNRPLRAGKGWLYEGGIRVPTIIRWKGVIPPARVSDAVVTSADFFPTILDFAGLEPEGLGPSDGVSLRPLLTGAAKRLDREAVYWHYPHHSNQGDKPAGAIRKGRYKLIEFFETGRRELYDLKTDVGESVDLAASRPDVTRELAAELKRWRQRTGARLPGPENPQYDPGP